MSKFQHHLREWLADPANTQGALADAIGKRQPAVNRYAKGQRFPDAETARLIDAHTAGQVPFAAWQADFLQRAGLDTERTA